MLSVINSGRLCRAWNHYRHHPVILGAVLCVPVLLGWLPAGSAPARSTQTSNSTQVPVLDTTSDSEDHEFCQADDQLLLNVVEVQPDSWLSHTFNLSLNPEIALAHLVQSLGTQVISQLNVSPWPTIHDRARLAKVPVMMYHDILPKKIVSFDLTIKEFNRHLELIKENGLTPISLDQLVEHLRTGSALPEKPIVLTFDDGYIGHYEVVYPLLKKYNYPAAFSIYTDKIDGKIVGRSTLTWEQIQEMAADPLITIVSHGVTHPKSLTELSDYQLKQEIFRSKEILYNRLGVPIRYFTYPEGYYDERVSAWLKAAGYQAALTMEKTRSRFSSESKSLLAIDRFGQAGIERAVSEASGGLVKLSQWSSGFNFQSPVTPHTVLINEIPLTFVSGGQPMTVLSDERQPLEEMMQESPAIAAVDGAFFSLKHWKPIMIGPIVSQDSGEFLPGNRSEYPKLKGRPLVLIGEQSVQFIPFDPVKHNSMAGIKQELPNLTDAFVGAGFLVRDFQPQSLESFGNLFDVNEPRHRAFWGIHHSGQPMIGVSTDRVGSVFLGELLAQAGFRDAVMLDSGASTSLAYAGESLVTKYVPRPVPHMVGLMEPQQTEPSCQVAKLSTERK
ncbi:MAG: polysaccharide deacetylase family protein [Microcoleaceae cyanobacterium]